MAPGDTANEKPTATNRGTVQLLAARMVFLVSGFFVSVILARGLGPVEFGAYGVVMSLLLWIEMVLAAGVPGATTKMLHDHPGDEHRVEQSAQVLLLLWAVPLFAACWFLAPTLADWFGLASGTLLFRLAILDLPLMAVYLAYQGILNGHRLFGALGASLIIHTTFKLLGILVLLAIGLSVAGALIAHVAATVVVLVFLLFRYPVSRSAPSRPMIRTMLGIALPMGGYLIALQILLGVGLWLLKALETDAGESVGFYVAALNAARVLTVVPSALTGILFVSLAWAMARSDRRKIRDFLEGATRFALVLLVPGCTLMVIDAEGIMALLFSETYRPGGTILRYQTVAFGAFAFFDILFHALMAAGAFRRTAAIVAGLVPVVVVFSFILIGSMGGAGAALALTGTLLAGTAIAAYLTYRRFGALASPSTVVRVALAATVIGLIASQAHVDGLWLVPKFMVLLALYAGLLALLREITREDLKPFAVWRT